MSMVQKADATNIAPNCGYVEHKHTAKCYYRKLICQNSDPEHIHDENCFEYVLMCGMHGHIHNAQCFETENNGHFVSLIELFSPTTSTAPEQVIVETASHPVIDNDEIVPTPEPVVHNSLPDEAVLEEFNRLDQQEENVQETQPPVLPSEDETDGESADNESAESVNDESVTVNTPVPEPVHNDPVISTPQPVRQEAAPVDATPTTEVIEESVHVEQEGIDLSPVVEEGTQEDITEAVEYYEPVTIEYLNASPAVVSPMQEVTFDYLTGNASMLSYTIYLNGEEVETGTLDSEAGSIFWTPETAGDFSIRLTAADARGNTTETVTKGTVYQNESKEEWLKKINDLELSGDWCKDIVTVAQSQKGTPASRMSEGFETKRLFTEQNTDDRFLSFILNWVGIPEERLSDFMMTDGPIDIGDIIYIDYDQDGKTDHMAIVTDAADNILHVVEVDMNGIINEGWYSADDELIVSFVDMAALAYVYQPVELLNELYGFSLTFTAGANIPDDAVFNVEKLDAESEGYAENLQMAESVLAYLDLSHVDMFNLSILEEENEIQPEKTVGVTLRLSDYQKEDNQNVHVVHIHDGRSEEVDAEWKRIDGEETVTFDADSFSVYAVCYTVEFLHRNVDGKVYDVSLAGGDAISLRSLADMLGLYENSEDSNGTSERFLQSIDTVKFSNEELVVPVRIEEDTTAGRLKEDLGLVCEYSAELSEEQIAAMNAKEFHAPDWVLISLKPFDSAEYLTVTMKSGEVFALQVTDAQSDHEIYLTNQYGNTVATFHIHFYDEEGNEIDGVTAFSASVGYDSNVNLTAGSEYVPVLEGYTFMQAQWGQEVIDQFYGSSNGSDATVNFLYDGESVGSFSTENQNETDIYLFYQNDNPQPGGDPDPGDDPQNETTASIRLHYYDENGTELAETKQITADATEDGTVVFLKEANEGPDQLLKLIDNMDFLYLQSHEFQGFDSIELTLTDEGMTCYFLQNGMYVGAYGMPDKVIDIDYRYTQDQDNVTVHFHYFDVDNQKIAEDYSVSVPVTNEGVDLMMSQYIPEIEGKVIKNTSVTLLNGQKSENFNKLRIIRNNDGEFFYTYVDDEYRGFSNLIGGDVDVTFVYGDPNGSVYEGGGTRPQHPKPVPEVDLEQLGDADGHKTLTPNGDGTYTVTLSMNVPHVEASSSSKANIVIIFDSSNSMHEPVEGNEWVRDDEHGTYTLYNGKYYKLAPFGAAIVQRLFRFTDDQGVTHTLGYDYYNPVSYCGPKYSPTYTRMDAAKAAVEYLAEKLLAKNTTANPDNIEIGFVEFASDIMQVHQPSTDEATVLSWVNACHTWFEETQDGSDSRGATNWDAALRIARGNTYEGHPEAVRFADDDPKYIIFISDGNPTARTTPDGLISGNPDDINAEYDDGTRIGTSGLITNMIPGVYGNGLTDPEGHNFARAEDQAREIVEDDKSELFNVSIFGDADRMQALSNTGYYDGSTEAGMREAFDAILAEASARMGYTNLTIMDGITSMTATTFVNNDPKNFTYKVTDANGNDVTDQRLTAEQRNAKFVPSPLDPNEGGTVTWELGADDFLLDGGTYSVSFVVWPNQASYDLVADLN
ncbi:MAG: hypothetical protein IKD69_05495, partial [Solobacterium sp.]|nr:hypothetical protein [Solobacterium sp.]